MSLPDYLQEAGKDFAKQLTASTAAPIDTSTFTGRQFVAGEDPLQSQAINLATQGIGSYQPFLQQAQQFTGTGAGTGAGSIASFMSPYQTGVIDETLRQFDQSRQAGLQDIADQAVAAGAFGGGREGALTGQYMADTTAARTGLAAQLLQSGFQDAAARRNQAMQDQFALANFQRAGQAADVSNLGQLGAFRQGINQSQLAADADAARTKAYEPFTRLDRYGAGITGLAGGVGGQQFQAPQASSPFATALSTALGIGGLFGKFR
jgi:hypothetical protein